MTGVIKMTRLKVRQLAKQATDQLIGEVEAGKSDRLRRYLAMMGRFHRYSAGNVLLISLQRPDATRVAGYRTWKRLGRQVRRGEKGIQILAPIVLRKKEDPDEDDDEEEILSFKSTCVFDVSQTDGEALTEFARVRGDPGQYMARLKSLVAAKGIRLEYSSVIGSAQGLSAKGRIVLRDDLDPPEELSTLAHELGHEMLHQREEAPADRTVRETEAEAVAFVVCQSIGLDTNGSASDYIQLYDGSKDTLLASLDRIQQTAGEIIRGILPEQERAGAA